jgi:methyltransferase (TIGR00027 family)
LKILRAMSHNLTKSKQELKLFSTLSTPQPSATQKNDTQSPEQQQGTSRWGLFFAATHTLSLPIERLLLKTLNAELGVPGCIVDPYAMAFRYSLLPSWRYKLTMGILASNYKKIVESSVIGVPGMLTYLDARTRWVDGHVKAAVQSADGFQQVIILGGGFDTRSLRLGAAFPSLHFFEVDAAQILNKKKALISELPEELAAASKKSQITFVPMDWTNPSALIPALTAAGFQPTIKTVVVMEGLLPHLDIAQANTILADAAALCAPGSKLLFDFLHLDAFDGSNRLYTGYSTLALALANKGSPFKSGHAIGFSDWVRATQRIHLRIAEVISPQNIALHLVRPEYEAAAAGGRGTSGTNSTNGLENSSEVQNWCSVGSCLAPRLRASQGQGSCASSALLPMSIALPQFYSLVSAVKTVPRISLKDAAPPLHLSTLFNNSNSGGGIVRRTVSSFESTDGPVTSCFFKGLASMIWGHDTDDEAEHPVAPRPLPPPPPPSAIVAGEASTTRLPISFPSASAARNTEMAGQPSYPSYSLERYQSSDWSLIASRGGEQGNSSQQQPQPIAAPFVINAGPSSLEHAISIPALQKYDDKGEGINKEEPDGGSGAGWWTSWLP